MNFNMWQNGLAHGAIVAKQADSSHPQLPVKLSNRSILSFRACVENTSGHNKAL